MFIYRLVPVGLITTITLTGCVAYQKKPVIPKVIFRDIDQKREAVSPFDKEVLTFAKVTRIMNENSPALDEIRAKYETASSIAKIKTPWPNPSIDIGPKISPTDSTQPSIGLGFTIPLGKKLRKNDDLNKAKALRAFVEVQSKHRQLYLELRNIYTRYCIIFRKHEVQNDLVQSSKSIVKLTKSFMKEGESTALDLGMIELDSKKVELDALELKNEREEIISLFSILLGIDASRFKQISPLLPKLKKDLPDYQHLKIILIENHLELALLRYHYEVAEKKLILEISKQYPDIQLGADRSDEDNSVSLGLRLGISIPIFDRNRQGITQATNEREHIRKQYIAIAHKALSKLKKAYKNIKHNQQRYRLIYGNIQQRSKSNLKIAKQALQSGDIGALQYLDVLRTYQQTMKELVLIESDVRMSWLELEETLGFPLMYYPGEETFKIQLHPQPESTLKE